MTDPEPLLKISSPDDSRSLPTTTLTAAATCTPLSMRDTLVQTDAQTSEKVVACLEESVKTLRKYEECLQDWMSKSKTGN